MIEWWWLLVAVSVTGVLMWMFIGKKLREEQQKSFVWQKAIEVARGEFDGLLLQVKDFRKRAEKAEGLAKVHMEANANFEKQRNDAWARYHAAGLGAGNAQAMLLGSLEGAVRELNRYRQEAGLEQVEVNQGLRDIVADFKREHVK